jgi:hypothetical protein
VLCRAVQDFGEHGREFITSEVGLRLLEVLGDPQKASQMVGGAKRAERLQAILQHCVFKVRLCMASRCEQTPGPVLFCNQGAWPPAMPTCRLVFCAFLALSCSDINKGHAC